MRSTYLLGNSDDLLPWRQAQQTGKTACPPLGIGERIQNRFLLKSVAVFHDKRVLHGKWCRRQPGSTTLAAQALDFRPFMDDRRQTPAPQKIPL
ncbi:MAG: hypothetical protein OXC27_08180 [Caldilineaceae bacterium]|nr:hypothetical protein [Caldilineaceae bacterium]